MGCGNSSEEVVPLSNVDPLINQIIQQQKQLKTLIFQHKEVSAIYRYLFNTEAKAKNCIMKLSENKVLTEKMEKNLVYTIAKYDADELREASKGVGCDEKAVAKVLVQRLPESIALTSSIYEQEHGITLETLINKEGKSNLGWLLTGGLSDFGKFMSYRVTPQPRRDALILRKAMQGMGCDDKLLLEILNTRTNAEMKEAVQAYQEAFDEDLVKRIKSETGGMFAKNYGKWIDRLVLFNRNEEKTCSYDKSQIDDFSDQLYNAGAGKTFGCNEDVFLEILNQANDATIELIVDAYKQYGDLQTDVEKKMGGDLEKAVVARITPRIDYLAIRVYQACKGFGTDEECIARILGCLTNHEVEKLVQRYNDIHRDCETPYNDFRTLMQSELSGDFLTAILIMLDGTSPKGHYRLKETYPEIANIECEKFQNVVLNDYNETLAISEGKSPMTGPLQFIGIHPLNMFQSRDMDDNYTPAFPYVEPTVDEILFRSVDGLVSGDENEGATEEKQALINSLNDAITQQESEIEKYKNLTPSLKVQYDNICKDFKYLDVLIGQYQNDCLEMKSFCSKHGIEIAD